MNAPQTQELVDRLVVVSEEEDVLYALVVLQEMRDSNCLQQAINATPLEGISRSSELSRLHKMIAQLLLLNGAVYEMEEGEEWSNRGLEELISNWENSGRSQARDAQLLLSVDINDAANWIDENLPLPPNPENLTGDGPLPPPPLLPPPKETALDASINEEIFKPSPASAAMCNTSERSRESTTSSRYSLTSIHSPTFESSPNFLPPRPHQSISSSPALTMEEELAPLYLASLPSNFSQADLLDLFSRIDTQARNPRIITGPAETYGFVDVKATEAEKCISNLNLLPLNGKPIGCQLKKAEPKWARALGSPQVRLHIGGLPRYYRSQDVEKMFLKLGVIPLDTSFKCKNQSTAFAFVTVDRHDVSRCIESIDRTTTSEGSTLSCYISKS
ncbi:hypothetical protein JCM5350_007507 [Sporobolomyces pararoseus]